MNSPHTAAQRALLAAEARFIANNPLSQKQHTLAASSLPGGNTRSLLHTSPFPLTMNRGQGTHLWDEDGHKYLDLAGDLSAGLLGHTPHPAVRRALLTALDSVGLNLGATSVQEERHAALLCTRFRLDRVRMSNSGTEANLHALAGARAFTGRRRVVVFTGGYHGGVLSFPSARGVQGNTVDARDFVVVPGYNDLEGARRVVERVAAEGDLAAVLVEAVQGAGGVIPGTEGFLRGLRDAARAVGAVFILDEVMTSRLAPSGLGFELGLDPDLVTLGKYLGGGLTFGAFGGRAEIMAVYDPRLAGSLAHSGTFNNNTLAMHTGYAALSEVYTPEVSVAFNAEGDALRERLVVVARGTRLSFTGRGSLIGLHFTEDGTEEITSGEQIRGKERGDLRDLFWFEMLEAGFWITRRGFIALMLGTLGEELDGFVQAVSSFLGRHRDVMTKCNQV
ncbi:pyridoxal phosphate-dependent transferase [Lasiosphaeris hirsuta]|uniref:Pyridoxal phosphate-dependent transferase n=1 Tax=Lasiosphaeris hirsuta TaxID=260670 RepID=A0AA40AZN6_9PEZI|nr:pyridoxal phosphate-dependent transferase [Lasiosphaeris hirsuta]